MTDTIETHGPQGSTVETVGRRPWRAPRLINLSDNDADGKEYDWPNELAPGIMGMTPGGETWMSAGPS